MLNKQSLIILVNKFIGQIKSLFSRFADKVFKDPISKLVVIISPLKEAIKAFIQQFQAKIKSSKLEKYIPLIKGYIEQVKSFKLEKYISLIKRYIEQAKSFKIKSLLDRFNNKKPVEIIPDGILGIHVTNNSITLVHLVFNNLNDIVVKSKGVFSLNSIDINLQQQEHKAAIENVINKYVQTNNLSRIMCSYVLSPQQYVISLIELPQAKDSIAMEKAILWSVKDYINYSIDDAILESFVIPVNRTQDNAKLAYAVAMRAKLSEEIGKLINNSGVSLKYIDISELCIRNIISLYPELQQGCLVLAIFDLSSSILLIKDNALFISRSTKLNIKVLDKFDPTKEDSQEKLSVAEKLVVELQRSLDYGNSIFRDLHFNTVAILPCKCDLNLVINWVGEQLGLPVRSIDLTGKIKFEQTINREEQADYMLAIGAALRGISNVTTN